MSYICGSPGEYGMDKMMNADWWCPVDDDLFTVNGGWEWSLISDAGESIVFMQIIEFQINKNDECEFLAFHFDWFTMTMNKILDLHNKIKNKN